MAKRGRPVGTRQSEEAKAKISKALTGRVFSEASKLKMSQAQKRRWLERPDADDVKENLRKVNIGRKLSEATKLKMSLAHRGKRLSEETKAKIADSAKARRRFEIEAIWTRLKNKKKPVYE